MDILTLCVPKRLFLETTELGEIANVIVSQKYNSEITIRFYLLKLLFEKGTITQLFSLNDTLEYLNCST